MGALAGWTDEYGGHTSNEIARSLSTSAFDCSTGHGRGPWHMVGLEPKSFQRHQQKLKPPKRPLALFCHARPDLTLKVD